MREKRRFPDDVLTRLESLKSRLYRCMVDQFIVSHHSHPNETHFGDPPGDLERDSEALQDGVEFGEEGPEEVAQGFDAGFKFRRLDRRESQQR